MMKRVYKEDTPIGTITKIRNILSDLPLLPIELSWFHPCNEVYSVRVSCPEDEGEFGTNGKGRNRHYALASAYAEFIERLQNGYIMGVNCFNRFFLNNIKKEHGFAFFPDEKYLTKEEFLKLPSEYLDDVFRNIPFDKRIEELDIYYKKLSDNGVKGVLSLPFYNCNTQSIIYLPFNLTISMSGSNGMSAGNTSAEGIFQALCELLERNASSTVYYNLLTPPTVPDSYLNQFEEELSIIKEIESLGFKVMVKDFSCGKSYPALAVIIINTKTNKYRLNVGADTSFRVALSRALTEIYQGIGNQEELNNHMLDIPEKEHSYFLNDSEEDLMLRSVQIRKYIINGSGVFPRALFESKESYSFDPATFETCPTYKEEVQKLIKTFIDSGHSVYIRDVSYLGFPSFYIYIPHISLFGRKTYEDKSNAQSLIENVQQDRIEDLFFPFETLLKDDKRIEELVNIFIPKRIENYEGIKMNEHLRLDFAKYHYWADLPVNYFLSLFLFILGEYDNATKYLKCFLRETENTNDEYYTKIIEYFELLAESKSPEDILKEIPDEIIKGFSSKENIFSAIDIPACPNCKDCKLTRSCKTKGNYELSKKIAAKMALHPIIDMSYIREFCS